jgi:ubiquinone/menaquinone biosynthesis C-methylase UbiE
VFGLDGDPEALNLARTKLEEADIEVQLDQGLASALPYADESCDRILSSLLFHHLSSELKLEAMREVLRVLRPGGEFHVADWGKPTGPCMRLAFVAVQLLDGFATTTDNVRGLLPDLLGLAGFRKVENYKLLFNATGNGSALPGAPARCLEKGGSIAEILKTAAVSGCQGLCCRS